MVETIRRNNPNDTNGPMSQVQRTNKSAQLVAELRARFMAEYEAHKYDGKCFLIDLGLRLMPLFPLFRYL